MSISRRIDRSRPRPEQGPCRTRPRVSGDARRTDFSKCQSGWWGEETVNRAAIHHMEGVAAQAGGCCSNSSVYRSLVIRGDLMV